MWPGSVGTIMKSQIVLNAQKNPYLNQATRKILAIIFHPKSKIPNPKKSFDYPCHLKSRVLHWALTPWFHSFVFTSQRDLHIICST